LTYVLEEKYSEAILAQFGTPEVARRELMLSNSVYVTRRILHRAKVQHIHAVELEHAWETWKVLRRLEGVPDEVPYPKVEVEDEPPAPF